MLRKGYPNRDGARVRGSGEPRRHYLRRGKDGIVQLEERLGAAVKATVERGSEGAQGVEGCKGFHDLRILLPAVTTGYSWHPSPIYAVKTQAQAACGNPTERELEASDIFAQEPVSIPASGADPEFVYGLPISPYTSATNKIPALRFRALLREDVHEVEVARWRRSSLTILLWTIAGDTRGFA